MKNIYLGILLLFFTIASAHAETIVAEKYGYKLYQGDIDKVVKLTRILARQELTNNDKRELFNYSIAKFKRSPVIYLPYFKKLGKMLKRIEQSRTRFEDDLAVQSVYHSLRNETAAFIRVKGYDSPLLIVDKYNPIFLIGSSSLLSKQKFFLQYKGKYVIKKEVNNKSYYLTGFMLDSIVKVAEFLAAEKLPELGKYWIRQWAEKDFIEDPVRSTKDFAYFINVLLPQIYHTQLPNSVLSKSASQLETEREWLYHFFYFDVPKRNSFNIQANFMDVVSFHNPVIIENTRKEILIPQSSFHTILKKYDFLKNSVGIPVKLTASAYKSEKNKLIKAFLRYDSRFGYYLSGAGTVVDYELFWNNASVSNKNSLTQQMKRSYRQGGTVTSALSPLTNQLWRNLIAQQKAFLSGNQIINAFSSRSARIFDSIANSITEHSTTLSIQLGGGRILNSNYNFDYFNVEYDTRPGQIYKVYF